MNLPTIPATALGGVFVQGWTGPAEQRNECDDEEKTTFWSEIVLMPRIQRSRPSVVADGLRFAMNEWSGDIAPDQVRLDPRREEVAHRIVDVLRRLGHEAGYLLPVALGGQQKDVVCERVCCGTGYVSPEGLPLQLDSNGGARCTLCGGHGKITRTVSATEVAALTLAASGAGVSAGKGVVRWVLSEWDDTHGVRWGRQGIAIAHGDDPIDVAFGEPLRGWMIGSGSGSGIIAEGPETGEEGRRCADAALLEGGFAFIDEKAPFLVRVPFLVDEKEVTE